MSNNFPFAIRLIGFNSQETEIFDATFALEQGKGYGYFRLDEDNLQDPDMYIANASELKALLTLADLRPSDVRPALLVGEPPIAQPYMRIERPIRWNRMFEALDQLIEKRADALSRLEASDVVAVPERRRRDRVDIDLTDPADYKKMRTELIQGGAVLVIDKTPAFRDFVAELLARSKVEVLWASGEAEAEGACARQRVAVVMINTSMAEIDPYRLCHSVKSVRPRDRTSVIFLTQRTGGYDALRAKQAGFDGFLVKPVAGHHLISALKKFMHLPR
ncbi:MAG TPA: response regulator [Oxalicibacterium sp.]|uniref:response regulator n=1 Tax=Oxalicibacterium sp. TaxID=2766525 RepID=UPI002B93DF21|nr:response regulator [Oxalicibacterium sp.]HWU99060.1 response regulator [Oxalicibacterium sp.]